MMTPEEAAAWRLFVCNWRVLGAMTATLVAVLAVTPFWIEPVSALLPVAVIRGYAGYTYYHLRHSQQRDPFVIFTLGATGQMLLIPAVMTPLTYIAASADLPLQDTVLHAVDGALHLDWVAYYNFFYTHHALLAAAVWSYSLIGCPVFGVPIALGWTERYRRLQVFTLAFAIALIATTIISAFVPAIGTYKLLHVRFDPDVFTPGGYLSSCTTCRWCGTAHCARCRSARSQDWSPSRASTRLRPCSISGRFGRCAGSGRSPPSPTS